MNASDLHLQNVPGGFLILLKAGSFQLANSLSLFLMVCQLVMLLTKFWWLHIVGILIFMNYLHFKAFFILPFPNTYFADLNPLGEFDNSSGY
jgi:hypothetical protein